MLKKRNAQGLSITTIIIAVIGLLIVIVLIAIFTGRIGGFSKGLDTAETGVKTCSSMCEVQGLTEDEATDAEKCKDANGRVLRGSFTGGFCCCV